MPSFLSVFVDTFFQFSLFSSLSLNITILGRDFEINRLQIYLRVNHLKISSVLIRDKVVFECHDFRRF